MKYLSLTIPGPGGDLTIDPVGGMPTGGIDKLEDILQTAVVLLFIFAIILCLFVLIYSGWQWLTSGGDKQKITQIKQRIIYAIIGLIVTFLAFMIINLLSNFFSAGILRY